MEAAAAAASERKLVVLYPSPGMGHLVSMVELGKLFSARGLAVIVVVAEPPYETGATAEFLAASAATNPGISFHRLPRVDLPENPSPHPEALTFDLLRRCNLHLSPFLRAAKPAVLVLDFFCACATDVADELGVPVYFFFTSGAAVLAVVLHLPVLHERLEKPFRELGGELLHLPGVPPIPANHMIMPLLDRDAAYDGFVDFAHRIASSRGGIINTFRWLEPRAIEAIAAGICNPKAGSPVPMYCIGPLIKPSTAGPNDEECMRWLDAQPKRSVVFLCFGSIGRLSAEQIKEMANGLEKSGHRFLWVVRAPPSHGAGSAQLDLDALLPTGFMARTADRGLVVPSWAPQTAVLAHEATGAFVTHCGWNSVLEAIVHGVPMVAWPLYAEQKMNKVFLVEEMHLTVAVEGYEDFVSADEVARKLRWVMESEEGKELKKKMAEVKAAAEAATAYGGESQAALAEVVKAWKCG